MKKVPLTFLLLILTLFSGFSQDRYSGEQTIHWEPSRTCDGVPVDITISWSVDDVFDNVSFRITEKLNKDYAFVDGEKLSSSSRTYKDLLNTITYSGSTISATFGSYKISEISYGMPKLSDLLGISEEDADKLIKQKIRFSNLLVNGCVRFDGIDKIRNYRNETSTKKNRADNLYNSGNYKEAIDAYIQLRYYPEFQEYAQNRINEINQRIESEQEQVEKQKEEKPGSNSNGLGNTNSYSNNYSASSNNSSSDEISSEYFNEEYYARQKKLDQTINTYNNYTQQLKKQQERIQTQYNFQKKLDDSRRNTQQLINKGLRDSKEVERYYDKLIEEVEEKEEYYTRMEEKAVFEQNEKYYQAWSKYYYKYSLLLIDWQNYEVQNAYSNAIGHENHFYKKPKKREPEKPTIRLAQPSDLSPYDYYKAAKKTYNKNTAIGYIQMALKEKPADLQYNLLLADLYNKTNRYVAAIDIYRRVLYLEPGNSTAKNKLQTLYYSEGSKYYSNGNYSKVVDYLGAYKRDVGANENVDYMYYNSIIKSNTGDIEYAKARLQEIKDARYQRDLALYNQTKAKNTIEACDVYLSKYPKGEFAQDVRLLKDNIAYKTAEVKNTFEAYMGYLKEYPSGKHIYDAKLKLQQFIDTQFTLAMSSSDISLCDNFMRNYPDSPKIAEISAYKNLLIENQYWQKVQTSNKEDDYKSYLTKYPNGQYVNAANQKLKEYDNKAYYHASYKNTTTAYNEYLQNYPNGNYRNLAIKKRDKKIKLDNYKTRVKNKPYVIGYNYAAMFDSAALNYPVGISVGKIFLNGRYSSYSFGLYAAKKGYAVFTGPIINAGNKLIIQIGYGIGTPKYKKIKSDDGTSRIEQIPTDELKSMGLWDFSMGLRLQKHIGINAFISAPFKESEGYIGFFGAGIDFMF